MPSQKTNNSNKIAKANQQNTYLQNEYNKFKDALLQSFFIQDFERVLKLIDIAKSSGLDDFFVKQSPEFLSNIFTSYIRIINTTKPQKGKITKEALTFATLAFRAYTKENKSNKEAQNQEIYAYNLALAYLANGNITLAKKLLENLAQNYVDLSFIKSSPNLTQSMQKTNAQQAIKSVPPPL